MLTATCSYGPHPAQVCELWLPGGRAEGVAGVVVLVHGGYWRERYDRSLEYPVARDLVGAGYAVWNVDYRGVGPAHRGGWPATFADVAAGVDLLADTAAGHALDVGRVALVGHSAGGTLALWAAARAGLPAGTPGAGPRVPPAGVVAQAAICDLVTGARDGLGAGAVVALMGGPPEPAAPGGGYPLASPAARLPLAVPVLVVTGEDDDTVPPSQSVAFAAAARQAGDDVELVVLPGEGHFGHLDPRSASWAVARGWLARLLAPSR